MPARAHRYLAVAALALYVFLLTTACNNGHGVRDEGPAPAGAATAR